MTLTNSTTGSRREHLSPLSWQLSHSTCAYILVPGHSCGHQNGISTTGGCKTSYTLCGMKKDGERCAKMRLVGPSKKWLPCRVLILKYAGKFLCTQLNQKVVQDWRLGENFLRQVSRWCEPQETSSLKTWGLCQGYRRLAYLCEGRGHAIKIFLVTKVTKKEKTS